jgi:predicted XRE-type DNA-binding protein
MPRKNTPADVFKHINMHNGDTNVCWEWKGKVNQRDGRPYFTITGQRKPSYVYVLEQVSGEEKKGRMVLHSCDNRVCCNPNHLSWGTHQDNMDDMKERERHGIPRTVIRAIHKLLDESRTQKDIAELYGISREAVSAIATGRNHKDKG